MTCHNKCSHEQEILDRLANIENKDLHTVQTVNGVYGPFITLDLPDVTSFTELVDEVNNMSFVKEVLSYTATPTTFKARVKMRDDTVVEMVLPPVSETDIGLMTPSAYAQVWVNKAQIEQMLLGTSIPTGDLETATPTQEQLTTLWTTTMTRDPADGDRVMNTFDNVVWMFATGLWHAISESSTPQATNSTLGTVMGSLEPGKMQVELDGTQSVNDWDVTQEAIISKIPKTDIVTSIGATPSDTKVPSEKAIKNALDLKIPKTDIVTSIGATPSDIKVPSEKASKDALDSKLDKITTPQTVKKVYTVGVDGVNGLDDYEYVGYEYPIPIFTDLLGTGPTVTRNVITSPSLLTIPTKGIVANGNLSSIYQLTGENTTGSFRPLSEGISFNYTEKNVSGVSCNITYMTNYGNTHRITSTTGSLTNGVITFIPELIQNIRNNLYVLGISF